MKKIIAAFDGLKYSNGTKQYALALAKQTGAHLVGVFLDDPTYTSYKIYELIVKQGVSEKKLKKFHEKDTRARSNAAADFDKACREMGIEHTIHHERNIALQGLKHESIFADIVIIDASETLTHYSEELPTRFVSDLLEGVHCPVLVVSSPYRPIEKIKLLYDRQPSSVHAIKMFSYLFSQFIKLPSELISLKQPSNNSHIPDNRLMKEFMKHHYSKPSYTILQGYTETEIAGYLKKEKGNQLVVTGAYSRGTVSRWFKKSMADILMNQINAPLFIAHDKY